MYSDFKYTVTEEDYINQLEIKDFLKKRFNFSSRLISKIKKSKGIYLNGETAPGWIVPKPGDILTIKIPKERSHFTPQDIPINVVYEDADLLVIDKQPGVIVHPTASHPDDTIANGIAKYCLETDQVFKLRFVNRLDRDTSGLLVIGKNSHCQDKIAKQMKNGSVEKEYIALVHGIIDEEHGTVDLPIGRPDDIGIKRKVMQNGSPCVTHYKVLERFFPNKANVSNPIDRTALDTMLNEAYQKKKDEFIEANPEKKKLYEYLAQNDEENQTVHTPGFTLLQLKLETGRTHQIRVHMSFIGHPIVGDTLYGTASDIIKRQALHAAHLSLKQPVTGALLKLQAPIPEDISKAIELIKKSNLPNVKN